MSDTIKRTILFYSMNIKNGNKKIDPIDHILRIAQSPLSKAGRYYEMSDGKKIRFDLYNDSFPLKIVLGYTRGSDFPLVDNEGNIEPLTLPEKAGLFDPTHLVIFQNGIVGIEYNSKGPRPQTLRYFLEKKIPRSEYSEIKMLQIINPDISSTLSRIGEIKAFEIAIRRNNSDYLKDLNEPLKYAMESLQTISDDVEEITVILKHKKYSKEPITLPFLKQISNWLGRAEVIDNLEDCKITAFDEELKTTRDFDLLNSVIFTKRDIIKMDNVYKSVDSDAMFQAIFDSYEGSQDTINKIIT